MIQKNREDSIEKLRQAIQQIADFPTPGIQFYDISTLLLHPHLLKLAISLMSRIAKELYLDKILIIESRGFIFGPPMALELNAGVVMARKQGKLPGECWQAEYDLEYGSSILELQKSAVKKGDQVLIVDDVLATGGTAKAAADLVEKAGGEVAGYSFLIELPALHGRQKLAHDKICSVLEY